VGISIAIEQQVKTGKRPAKCPKRIMLTWAAAPPPATLFTIIMAAIITTKELIIEHHLP
jgi:hypothetical protein